MTETGTLTITVAAVGDTVNDAVTVNEDNATTVNVLANDDFESAGRTVTAVSAAANGAVGFTAAGAVTYTPNAHWSGIEVLTYTVTSGGVTETGTFTITVTPVADAPTLTVGAASGNEDTAIALSVASGAGRHRRLRDAGDHRLVDPGWRHDLLRREHLHRHCG